MIRLVVPGDPVGKARPRTVRTASGRSRTYTPTKTMAYEDYVASIFAFYVHGRKLPGAIRLHIIAYYPIARSLSKAERARRLTNEVRPTLKPDFDNVEKIICDALNGLAFDDDSHIVDCHTEKYYSDDPRVEIIIESIGGAV